MNCIDDVLDTSCLDDAVGVPLWSAVVENSANASLLVVGGVTVDDLGFGGSHLEKDVNESKSQ